MNPEALANSLREMLKYAQQWYGYYESEFRIMGDPPDREWEAAVERAERTLVASGF